MNAAKKAAPKRKAIDKRNDKSGRSTSKTSKSKTTAGKTSRSTQDHEGGAGDSDVEDTAFVNRRAKRPKTGRIGRWVGKGGEGWGSSVGITLGY